MDPYFVVLCLGFGGLLLTSLVGLGHLGHAGAGRTHHFGSRNGHGPGHGAGLKLRAAKTGSTARAAHLLAALMSPVVLFSLLLGFGATGVLLRPLAAHWPLFLLPLVAAIDAGIFERYLVQPLWRLLFGFASEPAKTLESIVLEEGHAVTNFDGAGEGLIAVDLDGQVRQLLGRLAPEERAAGGRVRSGDRVIIRAVDLRRNSCTVSRLS